MNELMTGVYMALGLIPGSPCLSFGSGKSPVAISMIMRAVDNALLGCPTTPPSLSLSVHVARNADTQILQVIADLSNSGEVPVSYLTGCSALCRPKVYRAISFQVVGPEGTEVIVEDPCDGILLCPEGPDLFSPGDSVEQTLDITGTEWVPDRTGPILNGDCGTYSQEPFEPGRYKVIAQF